MSPRKKSGPKRCTAQNQKWPPSTWYGQTNFLSTGDNSKILFPSMGISYPGNSKKYCLSSWEVPMGLWGAFGLFQGKRGLSWHKC